MAIGGGLLLLGVDDVSPPEQRGIGVVVRPARFAPGHGLALSAAVRVRGCGEPVDVSINASGTSEFWIDNAKATRKGGTIQVAIPDVHIHDVDVSLGADGKTAAVSPLEAIPDPTAPKIDAMPLRRLRSVTVVGAKIPRWGVHLRPVIVRFRADWLQRRSYLGSCYLKLPALTGLSTVLSAREVVGQVATDVSKLDQKTKSIFVVSSHETGLKAWYYAPYETTRGVTSLQLGSKVLRSDVSQPGPDATVQGAPTWTCSSNPPKDPIYLETLQPRDQPDIVQGIHANAGALSVKRLGETVGQRTCASFAVIEEPSAAVARDITALLIGALFSIGVGLVTDGLRRRPVSADATA